jgi:hypothetical protein
VLGLDLLRKIGCDLDHDIFPAVHDRGVVEPGQPCDHKAELGGKVISYERQNSRGPTAWPRRGTAGGTWPSGGPASEGSGSTSTTSPFFSQLELNDRRDADFKRVAGAYPQVEFRSTRGLVWLLNYVQPIRGLEEAALIVTAYPLDSQHAVASWAWWGPGLIWIGPRHTNYYPSGSICSYEPRDGTWYEGESLTTLFDLNVVWIVRHLFLRRFGRWPGPQIFHTEWERLNEHLPSELCGGCKSNRKYEDCCQSADQTVQPIERLLKFMRWSRGNFERRPPRALSEYIYGDRKKPPSWEDLETFPAEVNLRFPLFSKEGLTK